MLADVLTQLGETSEVNRVQADAEDTRATAMREIGKLQDVIPKNRFQLIDLIWLDPCQ